MSVSWLLPLLAAPCAADTGVSGTPVNWSVLSSAGPEYAAGTSSLLLELLSSAQTKAEVRDWLSTKISVLILIHESLLLVLI